MNGEIWLGNIRTVIWVVLVVLIVIAILRHQRKAIRVQKIIQKNPKQKQLIKFAKDLKLPLKIRQEAISKLDNSKALAGVLSKYIDRRGEVLIAATAMLNLNPGDEYLSLFERVFEWITSSYKDYRNIEITGFLIKLAAHYPSVIRNNWGRIKSSAHADDANGIHNDTGDKAPHIDSTTYYDYFRYPDGRQVPNKSGRKKHEDYPMSASDCSHYDHADTHSHKDIADPDRLLREFPPAAIPPDETL